MVPPPCGECLLCKGLLSYGDGVDETTWTESTSRAKTLPDGFSGASDSRTSGLVRKCCCIRKNRLGPRQVLSPSQWSAPVSRLRSPSQVRRSRVPRAPCESAPGVQCLGRHAEADHRVPSVPSWNARAYGQGHAREGRDAFVTAAAEIAVGRESGLSLPRDGEWTSPRRSLAVFSGRCDTHPARARTRKMGRRSRERTP